MHIQSDRAFIPAGTPSTRYLSVTISAPAAAPPAGGDSAPAPNGRVSTCRSCSTAPARWAAGRSSLARQAVAHAIRLLKDDDQLSVVVYDDEVDTVLERMAATKQAQAAGAGHVGADRRARLDEPGGRVVHGRAVARRHRRAGRRDRGRATCRSRSRRGQCRRDPGQAGAAGASARQACRRHRPRDARAAAHRRPRESGRDRPRRRCGRPRRATAAQGISTSTFGLGADFDEELLTSLASERRRPLLLHRAAAADSGPPGQRAGRGAGRRGARRRVRGGRRATASSVLVLNGLPVEQWARGRSRAGASGRPRDRAGGDAVVLAITCDARERRVQQASVDCRVRDRGGVLFAEPMKVEWTRRAGGAGPAAAREPDRAAGGGTHARRARARRRRLPPTARASSSRRAWPWTRPFNRSAHLGLDDAVVQELIAAIAGREARVRQRPERDRAQGPALRVVRVGVFARRREGEEEGRTVAGGVVEHARGGMRPHRLVARATARRPPRN